MRDRFARRQGSGLLAMAFGGGPWLARDDLWLGVALRGSGRGQPEQGHVGQVHGSSGQPKVMRMLERQPAFGGAPDNLRTICVD